MNSHKKDAQNLHHTLHHNEAGQIALNINLVILFTVSGMLVLLLLAVFPAKLLGAALNTSLWTVSGILISATIFMAAISFISKNHSEP